MNYILLKDLPEYKLGAVLDEKNEYIQKILSMDVKEKELWIKQEPTELDKLEEDFNFENQNLCLLMSEKMRLEQELDIITSQIASMTEHTQTMAKELDTMKKAVIGKTDDKK